ncbi:MAG TPA: GNAT family N-acetyltransferase [Caulobacteraceae bacterium]|nr:GNAT family N-acetyltransferase [Caulobacteraceae bacterium]
MKEAVALRSMQPDEIETVALVWWRSSVSVARGADHPTWEALAERLAREPWMVTVAERNGEPLALLAVVPGQRWLRQLFVDPHAQGSGVGSALLEEAKSQMPDGFFLHTNADNTRARRFYEARGLTLTGEAPHPQWGQLQARYEWSPSAAQPEKI